MTIVAVQEDYLPSNAEYLVNYKGYNFSIFQLRHNNLTLEKKQNER